jgi:transcription initiation factor TFIIIB Brf1 subunit/transcription initiation factor TFIIB
VLRCPRCGSQRLAWSDETGHLVCQDCGAIIEDLIDDGPQPQRGQQIRVANPAPPLGELELALSDASERAIRRGKLVRVINGVIRLRSPATKHDEEASTALSIMEFFPELKSRTERVRLGIALYATLRAMGLSSSRAIAEAARRSGASPRSIESAVRRHREAFISYSELVGAALLEGRDPLIKARTS